jgi:hypothetical protein
MTIALKVTADASSLPTTPHSGDTSIRDQNVLCEPVTSASMKRTQQAGHLKEFKNLYKKNPLTRDRRLYNSEIVGVLY